MPEKWNVACVGQVAVDAASGTHHRGVLSRTGDYAQKSASRGKVAYNMKGQTTRNHSRACIPWCRCRTRREKRKKTGFLPTSHASLIHTKANYYCRSNRAAGCFSGFGNANRASARAGERACVPLGVIKFSSRGACNPGHRHSPVST